MEGERPLVTLPENYGVGKYARPVFYYVASWTLRSLLLAGTVAKEMRPLYHQFTEHHNIGE